MSGAKGKNTQMQQYPNTGSTPMLYGDMINRQNKPMQQYQNTGAPMLYGDMINRQNKPNGYGSMAGMNPKIMGLMNLTRQMQQPNPGNRVLDNALMEAIKQRYKYKALDVEPSAPVYDQG